MAGKRTYYDVTINEPDGEGWTPADLEDLRAGSEAALEAELDADVRVRYGNGIESVTWIAPDGYTGQGPLTEEMRSALEEAWNGFLSTH